MRVTVFLFSFILSSGIGWSQVKPTINLAYDALFLKTGFIEVEVGGGIRLNEHLLLNLNYRHSKNTFSNPLKEPMKIELISLGTGYRLLNSSKIVSPGFILDLGIPISSNANNTLMDDYFSIEKDYHTGAWRYNHGVLFGKLKAMCDFKLNSFNVLLGGSYNIFVYNKSDLISGFCCGGADKYKATNNYNTTMNFIGADVALIYTFSFKREK